MKTKGKTNPGATVEKAVRRFAEERERLAALPHPSPFLAARGRTLADYAEVKLGAGSQLSLRAKMAVVYEVTRLLDGGTQGEIRERAREAEALAALTPGTRVADRTAPGRTGVVVAAGTPEDTRVSVTWIGGVTESRTGLSLALLPGGG